MHLVGVVSSTDPGLLFFREGDPSLLKGQIFRLKSWSMYINVLQFPPTITGRKKEKAQLLEEVGPITCRKKMGCGFNVTVMCILKT